MAKGFGGRGGMGGMGMNANMLKQAQKMQQDMMRMQQELQEKEYEAAAGGGVVTATVTGKRELKALEIDPEAVDPDDVEMLQGHDRGRRQRGAAGCGKRCGFHHAETDRRARTAVLRGTTPHPPGRDRRDGALFYRWRAAERGRQGEKPGKAERRKK